MFLNREPIHIGDRVEIAGTRFALAVSPYAPRFNKLWADYGHRVGTVTALTDECPHLGPDSPTAACVITFDEGDQIAWETHFLRRIAPDA